MQKTFCETTNYLPHCLSNNQNIPIYPKYHYSKLFSSDNISNPGTKSHDDDCQANKIGYNLSVSRNQFFYQSSLIWNNLPVHIKKLEKIETFKKHLKQWIITNIQPF